MVRRVHVACRPRGRACSPPRAGSAPHPKTRCKCSSRRSMRTECVPARLRAAPAFRLAAACIPIATDAAVVPPKGLTRTVAVRLLRTVSSPSRSCPRRSLRPAATPPAGAHPPHPPPPVSRHCGYVIRADTELFVRTAAISAHDRRRSRPAAALGSALRPARPHSAPARRPRAPPAPAPAGERAASNAKPASACRHFYQEV